MEKKINTLKKKYRQFNSWQQQPTAYLESHEQHHCNNCGNDFTGHYCPTCGQYWYVGAVTWRTLRQSIMDIWGMGTRSLPSTLWQLLWRPGYLIGDYISGKRQVSFPPVKLLMLVALAIILVETYLNIDVLGRDGIQLFNDDHGIDKWLSSHYDWSVLFLYVFLLLPTYIVFRHSPRHTLHTLPQGFFIQVFQAIQFLFITLLFMLPFEAVRKLFGIEGGESGGYIVLLTLILIYIYYNYKQLFGYSHWHTLWRLAYCGVLSILLLIIITSFFMYSGYPLSAIVVFNIFCLITFGLFAHVVNTINRCNSGLQPHRVMRKKCNILIMVVIGLMACLFLCVSVTEILHYNHDPNYKDINNMTSGIVMFFICTLLIGLYIAEARRPDEEAGTPTTSRTHS